MQKDDRLICTYAVEILPIYNKNRVEFMKIVNEVNSQKAFEERYQNIINNNNDNKSKYDELMKKLITSTKKQEAKNLILAHDEYIKVNEKAYEMVKENKLSDAKKYIGEEAPRIHKAFGEIINKIVVSQEGNMEASEGVQSSN